MSNFPFPFPITKSAKRIGPWPPTEDLFNTFAGVIPAGVTVVGDINISNTVLKVEGEVIGNINGMLRSSLIVSGGNVKGNILGMSNVLLEGANITGDIVVTDLLKVTKGSVVNEALPDRNLSYSNLQIGPDCRVFGHLKHVVKEAA